MNLKPELKGSIIYIKDLDLNIEVSDDNIDLLQSVKAPVFEEVVIPENDNNKSRNSKRSLPDA